MKKILFYLLPLGLSFTFLSCAGPTKQDTKEDPTQEKEVVQEEKHQEEVENELRLNDGQRWEANPETTTGIENMGKILDAFSDESTEGFTLLKNELDKEFKGIFRNCTMKGEAHNQLHNFLIPLHHLLNEFDPTDTGTCKEKIKAFRMHLKLYPAFFV